MLISLPVSTHSSAGRPGLRVKWRSSTGTTGGSGRSSTPMPRPPQRGLRGPPGVPPRGLPGVATPGVAPAQGPNPGGPHGPGASKPLGDCPPSLPPKGLALRGCGRCCARAPGRDCISCTFAGMPERSSSACLPRGCALAGSTARPPLTRGGGPAWRPDLPAAKPLTSHSLPASAGAHSSGPTAPLV